jgi:AcrR family transcriptional regulator
MRVKTEIRPSRRRQPIETRRRILEAALRLFQAQGYGATTMAQVAEQAGVAVQTVYFTFHTKAALIMQIVLSVGADDPAAPPHRDRAWVREMALSTDPCRQLALLVEHGTDIFVRVAPLLDLVDAALATDPTLAEEWRRATRGRRDGLQVQLAAVERNGGIRPDVGLEGSADIVFTLMGPQTLKLLTVDCGWSLGRYKAWLYEAFCQQLLVAGTCGGDDASLDGALAGLTSRQATPN